MSNQLKPWYKKWWGALLIFFSFLVLSFVLAMGFYINRLTKEIKNNDFNYYELMQTTASAEELKLIEGTDKNYWIGAAKPKITIVEFADFACPHCAKSFSKIREISVKYKNSVKIIFRDFPINAEYSAKLALAARCAGEQGLFWPAHDKLFLNQGIATDEEIKNSIKQIGLDNQRFEDCYSKQKYLAEIQADLLAGDQLGITGTPTWFINGHKIAGDIPYELFIKIIEELIKLR